MAYLRVDDPRWYANAWTWLIAIPIAIVASLTWLAVTGNRVLRRTMQLAVVLGLIVHVLLLILAVETNIFHRIWTEIVTATQPVQRDEVRVPEYSSWQHDPQRRAERDFEQPVETELPEPEAEVAEPREIEQRPTVVEPQPLPVPEPEQTVQPELVKRKTPDEATPRQRDEISKLSRKLNATPAQPVQAVTVPDVVRQAERQREPLEATNAPLPPRRADVNARRQAADQPPRPDEDPSAVRMARQARDNRPQMQEPATVSVDRQLATPRVAPRSDVQSPARAAVAQETQPDALRPNNTLAEKQQTRSPEIRQIVEQPARDNPGTISSRERLRQQPAEQRPVVSRAPLPRASNRARNTSRPDVSTTAEQAAVPDRPVSAAPSPSAAASTLSRNAAETPLTAERRAASASAQRLPTETTTPLNRREASAVSRPNTEAVTINRPERRESSSQPVGAVATRVSPVAPAPSSTAAESARAAGTAPSPTNVTRQTTGNLAGQRPQQAADALGATPNTQLARRPVNRSQLAQPSLSQPPHLAMVPQRATRDAELASPTVAENPASSATPSTDAAAGPKPAQLALNKGSGGAAGVGQQPNLGRASPAASSPAAVVSGSAARARATQTMPLGPAMSPNSPALVRQNRAGRAQPSATLQATPLAVTTRHGSNEPGEVNASSSAALTEAASNAQAGNVTAARGQADVDLGPTTIVAQAGQGPAAGGGQPQTSPGSEPCSSHALGPVRPCPLPWRRIPFRKFRPLPSPPAPRPLGRPDRRSVPTPW